jgi:hypothetical protein
MGGRKITDSIREFIRLKAGNMTDQQIADDLTIRLGRPMPMCTVRKTRQRMDIKKEQGRGHCKIVKNTSSSVVFKHQEEIGEVNVSDT